MSFTADRRLFAGDPIDLLEVSADMQVALNIGRVRLDRDDRRVGAVFAGQQHFRRIPRAGSVECFQKYPVIARIVLQDQLPTAVRPQARA